MKITRVGSSFDNMVAKSKKPEDYVKKGHVMIHREDTEKDYPAAVFTEDPKVFIPNRSQFYNDCVNTWGLIDEDDGSIESIMRKMMGRNKTMTYYSEKLPSPVDQFISVLAKRKKDSCEHESVVSIMNSMLTLRIAIEGSEDDCWRRVKLPASTPLNIFHDQIIVPVMGWCRGYHGYVFEDPTDGAVLGPKKHSGYIDMMHIG